MIISSASRKPNILTLINKTYSKYLYVIVPSITLILNIIETIYEIKHGDIMHILANAIMGFVSLCFCGFYLMSGKEKISYCLIEIYLFLYTLFLALDNHLHFNDIIWIVFLPCSIICLILIIIYNKKGK